MKKIILGTFESRPGAQTLIQHLRQDLNLPQDDISCIYRDSSGEVFEVIETDTEGNDEEELTDEVKNGTLIGGSIGLVGGVAMLLGIIPALGPIFDTNIVVKMIGLGASAIGSLAVGALIGAIIGGIVASLFSGGEADEEEVEALPSKQNHHPDVLVVAHARDEKQVGRAFTFYGASGVEVYTPTLT